MEIKERVEKRKLKRREVDEKNKLLAKKKKVKQNKKTGASRTLSNTKRNPKKCQKNLKVNGK